MTIKLTFLGASGTVTGSSYLIETDSVKFLVDCGLFQGDHNAHDRNYAPFHFDPKTINFVLLTHAHLDHCGLLPRLAREGFNGKIYSTPPTRDLAELIMTDEAQIQENGVRFEDIQELFGMEDAKTAIGLFEAHRYKESFTPKEGITVTFQDAGHILGSSIIEIKLEDKKLVFSGDLGNSPVPILKDPAIITEATHIICESTYGDRTHPSIEARTQELLDTINFAREHNSKLIIPAFALERTQDLLYTFNQLSDSHQLGDIPVILDSPLAINITKVYEKYTEYFDEDFQSQLVSDSDLFNFPGFQNTPTRDESIALNDLKGAAVIIAGSGMADAGRVQHHLLHRIEDPENQVVFVGFCAPGTLGRDLLDGAKYVRVRDTEVPVRAQIKLIGSFSAHADQPALLHWLGSFETHPQIFLTHGENSSREVLSKKITEELKLTATLPELGQSFNL